MFVRLWMHAAPITIGREGTIAEAGELMQQHKIRRLLVLDEQERLVGIISKEDLKNALPSIIDANFDNTTRNLARQAKVEGFMTANPITTEPGVPLEKVAATMRRHKIGGIPVVDEGRLVGIITESDICQAFTEILGGNEKGTRLELAIRRQPEAMYSTIDLFRRHEMTIQTLTVCNDCNSGNRLLTIRFEGDEIESLTEALWQNGCTINSIVSD
jgi:acetoin utilization protein AcuB